MQCALCTYKKLSQIWHLKALYNTATFTHSHTFLRWQQRLPGAPCSSTIHSCTHTPAVRDWTGFWITEGPLYHLSHGPPMVLFSGPSRELLGVFLHCPEDIQLLLLHPWLPIWHIDCIERWTTWELSKTEAKASQSSPVGGLYISHPLQVSKWDLSQTRNS